MEREYRSFRNENQVFISKSDLLMSWVGYVIPIKGLNHRYFKIAALLYNRLIGMFKLLKSTMSIQEKFKPQICPMTRKEQRIAMLLVHSI